MSKVVYQGNRAKDQAIAWRIHRGMRTPLKQRQELWNHSPTGFEWGYGGSGPAQLALALLCDALNDDERAVDLHQAFKWAVVCKLDHLEWELEQADIIKWAEDHDQRRADKLKQEQWINLNDK
jgi:hypothetical protein